MRGVFSFFSGVIFGSLAGATLALLFTPYSGQTLRSDIQTRYIEIRDEVQSAAEARRSDLESQLEALRKPTKSSS
jgi:gas vesicle protein